MTHFNKREPVPLESDFRLKVTITDLGDNLRLDDNSVGLTCTLSAGSATVTVQKSSMKRLDHDSYIIAVNANTLAKGDLYITTHTSVPDTDFNDNIRNEVKTKDTGITIV